MIETDPAESKANPAWRQDLASVVANQAMLLARAGELTNAIKQEDKAVSLLEQLAGEFPDVRKHRIELAKLLGNRGNARKRLKQFQKAESDYRSSIDSFESLIAQNDDHELIPHHAVALTNLAGLHAAQPNQLEQSAALYKKAIDQLSRLVVDGNAKHSIEQQLAFAQQNLARILLRQKQTEEAVRQFRAAVQTQQTLSDKYPSLLTYRQALGRSLAGLGSALSKLGLDGAEEEMLNAKSIAVQLTAKHPERIEFQRDLAGVYETLGVHYRKGETDQAIESYRESMRLRREIELANPDAPRDTDRTIAIGINFANYLRECERFEPAIKLYREVLSKLDSNENPAANLLRATLFGLGDSSSKASQFPEALECWERLVENRNDPGWATFELQRAICNVRIGQIEKGVSAAEGILDSQDTSDGFVFYDVACCYAVASHKETEPATAQSYATTAVKLLEKAAAQEFFSDDMKQHIAKDSDIAHLFEHVEFKEFCEKNGIDIGSGKSSNNDF